MSPAWTVVTAVSAFAATNVDDLLVLTSLFAMRPPVGSLDARQIVAGQYAGFMAIVAVSVLAAVGLQLVPDRHVRWLGLVPFVLGLRGLVQLRRREEGDAVLTVSSVGGIAGLTFANGADNISVYTPLLRQAGGGSAVVMVVVFLISLAGWCLAGAALSRQRHVQQLLDRYGHVLVPLVFVALGALILAGVL